MTSKEYLQQIKKLDTLIKNKTVEIEHGQNIGVDISVIKNERQQLINTRQEIISNLQNLSADHYDVLHKVYVQGKKLYEAAGEMDISYSYATKLHGWALQSLGRIIKK